MAHRQLLSTEAAASVTAATSTPTIEIPAIAHSIWAGGEMTMPSADIAVISDWIIKNPEFKLYLWVDKATSGDASQMLASYAKEFAKHGIPQVTKSVAEKKGCVAIKDIREEKIMDEYIQYEIEKLTPNYGASSDLIRYAVLYQFGGVYLDSDVRAGKTAWTMLLGKQEAHVLYVDHCTQRVAPAQEKLTTFDLNEAGNDTLICTRHNPLMRKMSQLARYNYDSVLIESKQPDYVAAHSGKNRETFTIELTGPALVQSILHKNVKIITEDTVYAVKLNAKGKLLSKIYRTRDGRIELSLPLPHNTQHWVLSKTHSFTDVNAAVQRVAMAVQFELRHFRILRLDDHMDDLIAACKTSDQETLVKAVMTQLDKWLEKQSATQIPVYVHVTGKYPQALSYCKSKKLFTLFEINKSNAEFLVYLLHRSAFTALFKNRIETDAKMVPFTHSQAGRLFARQMQSDHERLGALRYLCSSIDYLENIASHLDQFSDKAMGEYLLNFLLDRLSKNNQYLHLIKFSKASRRLSQKVELYKDKYALLIAQLNHLKFLAQKEDVEPTTSSPQSTARPRSQSVCVDVAKFKKFTLATPTVLKQDERFKVAPAAVMKRRRSR